MVLPVIGAGLTAKQIKEKLEENKKREQSRNPDPKTPKIDTDNKESESTKKLKNPPVILVIDGKKYTVQSLSDIDKITNKGGKTANNLSELKPARPGIDKPTGEIQSFSKGGRAMYSSGSKVKGCKLAKKGKGRAYGKNS